MKTHLVPKFSKEEQQSIANAMGWIPSGVFLLAASSGRNRAIRAVKNVQLVCQQPPTIAVMVPKGCPVMAWISQSHRFLLCQLGEKDSHHWQRRFAEDKASRKKPLDMMGDIPKQCDSPGGIPVPTDVLSWMECDLMIHHDTEGDCDMIMGRVLSAGKGNTSDEAPLINCPSWGQHV